MVVLLLVPMVIVILVSMVVAIVFVLVAFHSGNNEFCSGVGNFSCGPIFVRHEETIAAIRILVMLMSCFFICFIVAEKDNANNRHLAKGVLVKARGVEDMNEKKLSGNCEKEYELKIQNMKNEGRSILLLLLYLLLIP